MCLCAYPLFLSQFIILTKQEILDWAQKHLEDDPDKLRFRYHGSANYDCIEMAISHIESLRKSSAKFRAEDISLKPELLYPPIAVEQSTSAALAMLHRNLFVHHLKGKGSFLDLTCGLGIDSRAMALTGCDVTSLEIDQVKYDVAEFNFRNFENVNIFNIDCREFLNLTELHFDIIYIDPSRRSNDLKRVYGISDCRPDVLEMIPILKQHASTVFVKLSPMIDISQTLRDFDKATNIYVLGYRKECKELLVEIDFDNLMCHSDVPIIVYESPLSQPIVFNQSEICNVVKEYYDVDAGEYVYVPSAVMSKAGCYGSLATRFNLDIVSANTHLLHGHECYLQFPGNIYRVNEIRDWSSRNIKFLKKKKVSANIIARNFDQTPDNLRKLLNVKDSDETTLIFYRNNENEKKILITSRV